MRTRAYDRLTRHWTRLHRFEHVLAVARRDRPAMMPPNVAEARAQVLAEMEAMLRALRSERKLAAWLAAADGEPLEAAARANLREMRRVCDRANALPPIAAGDLAPVFDWLRDIWLQASRWTTAEPAKRASGETLNPLHFRRHLEARYLASAAGR